LLNGSVEQQNQFLSYVLFHKKEHQYPLSLIANMNKIPIAFNLPSNITVEHHGTKSVSILSTEHKCANFTVILAYITNGEKLPSVIIFKLVIVRTNSNGWMNEDEITW